MSITLHWGSVIAVFFLFGLGLWMDDLDYYDPWYRTAPDIHKGVGVLFISLVFGRLVWRLVNTKPKENPGHKPWEKKIAGVAHWALYLLMILMLPTGYLITTASGQGLSVFDWFTLPPLVTNIDNLEDVAGEIHELFAYSLILLVILHAVGAVKHHFWDKDNTLKRMLIAKDFDK